MKLVLAGAGALITLAIAAPSFGGIAAPSFGHSAPIVAKPIAVGTMQATTIQTGTGAVVLDRITVPHGGTFGWHTHGAPVAVVVTGGTLTVFDPSVGKCAPFQVSKGQSFVEPAGHVHLARNDGKRAVTLYAMYLGLPSLKDANAEAKAPAGCNA
ncbi:MAG: cupin domain-containing protein [Actinobacteria bacterium]|nr:cupin domain-containing protein [Actinomycetota bacterium]